MHAYYISLYILHAWEYISAYEYRFGSLYNPYTGLYTFTMESKADERIEGIEEELDPETSTGSQDRKRKIDKPRKADYRQRAVGELASDSFIRFCECCYGQRGEGFHVRVQHCNPLADATTIEYPISPDWVDWSLHYPSFFGKSDDGILRLNSTSWSFFGVSPLRVDVE
jgi:hypothetical protein